MLFSASFVTLAIALSGVVASPGQTARDVASVVDYNLSAETKYNAPTPPWQAGSHPGWYYGNGKPPAKSSEYPPLTSGGVRTCSIVL